MYLAFLFLSKDYLPCDIYCIHIANQLTEIINYNNLLNSCKVWKKLINQFSFFIVFHCIRHYFLNSGNSILIRWMRTKIFRWF